MKKLEIVLLSSILLLSLNASAQSLVNSLFITDPKYYEFSGQVRSVTEIDTSNFDCNKQLKFNRDGQLIKSQHCSGRIVWGYNHVYGENGRNRFEISASSYDTINVYLYDNNGNVIQQIHPIGYWVYSYDNNNNQVERIGYIGDRFIERWRHLYDDENRRIREEMIDQYTDSVVYIRRDFKYDEHDNIIKQVYWDYGANSGRSEDTFKYDEHKNVVEWKREDDDGSVDIEAYTYKYDDLGNWIEKTIYEEGEVIKSITREIEYWK